MSLPLLWINRPRALAVTVELRIRTVVFRPFDITPCVPLLLKVEPSIITFVAPPPVSMA